jgi:dihydrofolate reductase
MTASRPRVTLIVAVSTGGVIGHEGGLPWRLAEDLRRFKMATLGKPIIMGRKTFESIGRALPGRHNIVLTRRVDFKVDDPAVTVVRDWPSALRAAGDVAEVMVIGGAEIYALALPQADCLLRSRVHAEVAGDTLFPDLEADQWHLIREDFHARDERNEHDVTFECLERRHP